MYGAYYHLQGKKSMVRLLGVIIEKGKEYTMIIIYKEVQFPNPSRLKRVEILAHAEDWDAVRIFVNEWIKTNKPLRGCTDHPSLHARKVLSSTDYFKVDSEKLAGSVWLAYHKSHTPNVNDGEWKLSESFEQRMLEATVST
jgi:hypothetical protein